jgi:murein DD-endopeptidase MepM/ murein hydrolase activator NlpD
MKKYLPFLLILLVFIWSCGTSEYIEEQYYPTDTHDEYRESLQALDLGATDMGGEWMTAGDPASNPTALSLLPFQERRFFDTAVPDAAYYLIEGLRGQTVVVDIATDAGAGYFADLFGLDDEFIPEGTPEEYWEGRIFEKVAAARTVEAPGNRKAGGGAAEESGVLIGSSRLEFEPRKHRFYLLRIQPRLLEGGEFLVTFNSDPLLSWPIPDSDIGDVQSFFGAPRDGGDRVHHGIDIFVPRGTPVVAVDDTSIYRIQVRERGGNTVFLNDSDRGLIYYYAHLDEWAEGIEQGMDVPAGMELGTVGNTGNAVYGPPHLHFGIYQTSWRGALDPWYFFIDVAELPDSRRAAPLPSPEQLASPATDGAGAAKSGGFLESAALYAVHASRSLFTPSPAVSDRDGNDLSPEDMPVMRTGWGEQTLIGPEGLRLVAARADAYGFIDEERRVWWLPNGRSLPPSFAKQES